MVTNYISLTLTNTIQVTAQDVPWGDNDPYNGYNYQRTILGCRRTAEPAAGLNRSNCFNIIAVAPNVETTATFDPIPLSANSAFFLTQDVNTYPGPVTHPTVTLSPDNVNFVFDIPLETDILPFHYCFLLINNQIIAGVENSGSAQWNVPTAFFPKGDLSFKIALSNEGGIYSWDNSRTDYFTIVSLNATNPAIFYINKYPRYFSQSPTIEYRHDGSQAAIPFTFNVYNDRTNLISSSSGISTADSEGQVMQATWNCSNKTPGKYYFEIIENSTTNKIFSPHYLLNTATKGRNLVVAATNGQDSPESESQINSQLTFISTNYWAPLEAYMNFVRLVVPPAEIGTNRSAVLNYLDPGPQLTNQINTFMTNISAPDIGHVFIKANNGSLSNMYIGPLISALDPDWVPISEDSISHLCSNNVEYANSPMMDPLWSMRVEINKRFRVAVLDGNSYANLASYWQKAFGTPQGINFDQEAAYLDPSCFLGYAYPPYQCSPAKYDYAIALSEVIRYWYGDAFLNPSGSFRTDMSMAWFENMGAHPYAWYAEPKFYGASIGIYADTCDGTSWDLPSGQTRTQVLAPPVPTDFTSSVIPTVNRFLKETLGNMSPFSDELSASSFNIVIRKEIEGTQGCAKWMFKKDGWEFYLLERPDGSKTVYHLIGPKESDLAYIKNIGDSAVRKQLLKELSARTMATNPSLKTAMSSPEPQNKAIQAAKEMTCIVFDAAGIDMSKYEVHSAVLMNRVEGHEINETWLTWKRKDKPDWPGALIVRISADGKIAQYSVNDTFFNYMLSNTEHLPEPSSKAPAGSILSTNTIKAVLGR